MQVGLEHGKAAREQILRGLQFYKAYYVEQASLEWPQAVEVALKFMPVLQKDWPDFMTEMRGDSLIICSWICIYV
jgi:isopenicillin-N N-acyltransferase like protein